MRIGRKTTDTQLRHVRLMTLCTTLFASAMLTGCTQAVNGDFGRFLVGLARSGLAAWLF